MRHYSLPFKYTFNTFPYKNAKRIVPVPGSTELEPMILIDEYVITVLPCYRWSGLAPAFLDGDEQWLVIKSGKYTVHRKLPVLALALLERTVLAKYSTMCALQQHDHFVRNMGKLKFKWRWLYGIFM